mmetsp:Transcript_13079/g.33538  ORF Transcript_13079/g.33538 Transcript_13079/m.33538 type:complete len:272 (+) Transcript_13079:116-931(+)
MCLPCGRIAHSLEQAHAMRTLCAARARKLQSNRNQRSHKRQDTACVAAKIVHQSDPRWAQDCRRERMLQIIQIHSCIGSLRCCFVAFFRLRFSRNFSSFPSLRSSSNCERSSRSRTADFLGKKGFFPSLTAATSSRLISALTLSRLTRRCSCAMRLLVRSSSCFIASASSGLSTLSRTRRLFAPPPRCDARCDAAALTASFCFISSASSRCMSYRKAYDFRQASSSTLEPASNRGSRTFWGATSSPGATRNVDTLRFVDSCEGRFLLARPA